MYRESLKFAGFRGNPAFMKLSELTFGQVAEVVSVNGEELSLKLFEMGLLPGEQVSLENVAPFGDPIAIMVGEYKMCLRKSDADQIFINLK